MVEEEAVAEAVAESVAEAVAEDLAAEEAEEEEDLGARKDHLQKLLVSCSYSKNENRMLHNVYYMKRIVELRKDI